MTRMLPSPLKLPSDCPIEPNVILAELATYRVGGPAEWFIAPHTLPQLQTSVAWATAQNLPITVLGAGSNLLISDRGLPGLVISTRYLREQTVNPELCQATVDAGKPLPRLCWQLAKQGFSGLEWAVGIPGTVGGAVVMNAGAHGGEIADCLVEAVVLQPDGTLQTLRNADLNYSYRSSSLQGQPLIVLRATFALQSGQSPEAIQKQTESHLNHRLTTQPYEMPSCGSVFRNPKPHKAGWLIEQSGLKGYCIGGAQVSEKHANFIVNRGDATAADIHALIYYVQQRIEDQWGLTLHPEVKILGQFETAATSPASVL